MPVYDTNAWLTASQEVETPQPPTGQPETTFEGVVTAGLAGVVKGFTETFQTINQGGLWLEENIGRLGTIRLDKDGLHYTRQGGGAFIRRQNEAIDQFQKTLPTGDTTAERLVSGIAQIAAPMGLWGKALKAGKGVIHISNQTKRLYVTGAISDFSAFDPYEARLSNFLADFDNPVLNNAVTRYLSASPEDGVAEGRLKSVLEGLAFGGAVDGILRALNVVKGVRTARKEIGEQATKRESPTAARDAEEETVKSKLQERKSLAANPVFDTDEKDFISRRFHARDIYPDLDALTREKEVVGNINSAYGIFRKKIRHDNSDAFGRLTGHSKMKDGKLWLRMKTKAGHKWFPADELGPKADVNYAIANRMFKEVKGDVSKGVPFPKEIYDEKVLSNPTVRAVTSAVDHIAIGNQDEGVKLFRKISESIEAGEIQPENMKDILQKYELDAPTFAKLFEDTVSKSARNLAYLSHVSRRLSKVFEGEREAVSIFEKQARRFKQDAYLTDKMAFWWQSLEDWRRSLLVTQLATAMRNIFSQAPRAALGAFDDALQSIISAPVRKIYKATGAEIPRDRTLANDMLGNLNALSAFRGRLTKKGRARVDEILDENPYQQSRLISQPVNEVYTANKVSQFLNTYNRAQEIFFRKFTFEAKLRKILTQRGLDYNTVDMNQITKEELEESVRYALEMTFSASPKTQWAKNFIRFWSRTPLTLVNPFPRFNFANALPFLVEHNPLYLLKLANPKMYSKAMAAESADEIAKVVSRAAIGTGMLTLAWNIKDDPDLNEPGMPWYQLKNPNNPKQVIDIRAYAPFSTYAFIAEAIKDNIMVQTGERSEAKIPVKEYAKQALAVNRIAGTSLEIIDMFRMEKGDSLLNMTKRIAGQYVASFSVPAKTLKDLAQDPEGAAAAGGLFGALRKGVPGAVIGTGLGYGYGILGKNFMQEEHVLRDVKEDPLWAPFVNNIPGLSQVLPEDTNPILSTPVIDDAPEVTIFPGVKTEKYQSERPVLRQLSGLSIRPKKQLEREIDRLGISKKRVWNSTGNPKANRLLDGYTGQLRSLLMNPIIESDYWNQQPEYMQKIMMRRLLRDTKKKAMQLLALRHTDLWMDLKWERMSDDNRDAYDVFGIEQPTFGTDEE